MPALFFLEVTMHLDKIFQVRILPGDADAHIGAGAQLVEARGGEETGVFGFDDERIGIVFGREGHTRVDGGNDGVDVCGAFLAGDGDAMVAVEHKVGVADLVDVDGW